jgi:Glycosyl hydrolases family 25/Putative peptidoglycan binding domain
VGADDVSDRLAQHYHWPHLFHYHQPKGAAVTERKAIDVSSNNHPGNAPIDYAAVKADGYDVAFVKLTEGTTYANPYADADCEGFRAAGLEVVPYHFARPESNAWQSEADWFAQHIGASFADCRRALDLEDGSTMGWTTLAHWVQGFIGHVRCEELYVDDWYFAGLHGSGVELLVELWRADPGDQSIPAGANAVQTGQGSVPGITGPVDLDLVGWEAPAAPEPEPAPPPEPAHVPVDPPAAPPAELGSGLPNLMIDSAGGFVAVVQRLLALHGVDLVVDGVFGPATQAAVQLWQQQHGLTSDGVVGPVTWTSLLS